MSLESPDNATSPLDFSDKIVRLKDRAYMLGRARHFFDVRKVIEVDCPILSRYASIDTHIHLIEARYGGKEVRYLHSSPEFGMKRLLVEGIGDIYQISHVFRDEEWSEKHHPEFTMAEWYRLYYSLEEMIDETVAFIRLFLGELPFRVVHYRDLFLRMTGIDYLHASDRELFAYVKATGIPHYAGVADEGKDALLNLILGSVIEPQLGKEELFILAYYPVSQAALAKKCLIDSVLASERFEVYYQGMELANGYHELGDPEEQRLRFLESNDARKRMGKKTLPIDAFFLRALEKGLPDCSGVAVGFDRLMMLRQHRDDIADVVPCAWEDC